jgi:hypothetical protein
MLLWKLSIRAGCSPIHTAAGKAIKQMSKGLPHRRVCIGFILAISWLGIVNLTSCRD